MFIKSTDSFDEIKRFILQAIPYFIAGFTREMLLEYIEKFVDEGKTKFRCTLCGTVNGQRAHSENHVENIHFPGSFTYNCKYCEETFTLRNKLYKHVNSAHKNMSQHGPML